VGPDGRWQAFFCNPNIHPLIEFRRRLKAVQVVAHDLRWPLTAEEGYGLQEFLEQVDWRTDRRCRDCYRLRLRTTAEVARRQGYDHFTTTLLTSTQQPHELVRQIGDEVGREAGVTFVAEDWRSLSRRGYEEARRRSLYRQQYCGCIFSEFGRYRNTGLHLYRGGGRPPGSVSASATPSAFPGHEGRGHTRGDGS
jgi:predicted adenine nucleotide alpha hydrolase (AANH) superfamily ATPase